MTVDTTTPDPSDSDSASSGDSIAARDDGFFNAERRQRIAVRLWSSDAPALHWQLLSWLYGAVTAVRRGLYRRKLLPISKLPVPVIVVGNLTVGGSGKTPLVMALIEALQAEGWNPGVISRGYGRDSQGLRTVTGSSQAAAVGDEPLLIASQYPVPVAVSERRVEAARALLNETSCNLLIADDGLQHYPLGRDIEVLVIDGRRGFGNGRLLPAGPMREPRSRAKSCHLQVVNGGDALADGQYAMHLKVQPPEPLNDGPARGWDSFIGQPVHAVAGIGDPERFFCELEAQGLEVLRHPFPDHHRFQSGDLAFGDDLPILMTAKDAIKCRRFAPANACVVNVSAEIDSSFFDALIALLPEHLGAPPRI